MLKNHSLQNQGIILALAAMLSFSINDGILKYAFAFIRPEIAVFTAFGFAFISLMLYGRYKKIAFAPNRKRNAVIFGIFFTLEQMTFVYALKHIPIAELFIVILCAPVAVLVLSSIFLKEHLEKHKILAVFFGFAGAITVVSWPLISNSHSDAGAAPQYLAWIAAIANVALNSGKIIYMRKFCQEENTFSLAIIANLFVMIFFAVQISPTDLHFPLPVLALLACGGLLGGLGSIAYVRSFQLAKAALISATQYSQIIWAVLMGVFIFKEELTMAAVTGSLLILASGYMLYLRKNNSSET